MKKKENPYLAHRSSHSSSSAAAIPPGLVVPGLTSPVAAGVPGLPLPTEALLPGEEVVDERIPAGHRRDLRAKKGLKFVEAGKYLEEEKSLRTKEERKLIAGYSSGRKALEVPYACTLTSFLFLGDLIFLLHIKKAAGGEVEQEEGGGASIDNKSLNLATFLPLQDTIPIPPPPDVIVPSMEWWDEAFLPKEKRDQRRVSRAAAEQDDFPLLSATHCKVIRLVQHPLPVRPPGSAASSSGPPPLPTFLTKKERKKLRKATRAEREQEKRDKLMMGLIPAPEPKFKLSNFMKVGFV